MSSEQGRTYTVPEENRQATWTAPSVQQQGTSHVVLARYRIQSGYQQLKTHNRNDFNKQLLHHILGYKDGLQSISCLHAFFR